MRELPRKLNQRGEVALGEVIRSFIVWFWVIVGGVKLLKILL
jgi:hypothetical protein